MEIRLEAFLNNYQMMQFYKKVKYRGYELMA